MMALIKVTSNKTNRTAEFEKDFGGNLEAAAEKFGAEVVYSIFEAQAVIRCQAAARTTLDNPENSVEKAIASGEGYTPGIVRRTGGGGASAMTKVLEAVSKGSLSKEQVLEFLQKLQSAQAEEEAAGE
jgi:hypothetical protein